MTNFLKLFEATKNIKIIDSKTGCKKSFQRVIGGSLGAVNNKECQKIANVEDLKKVSIEGIVDGYPTIVKALSLVDKKDFSIARAYCLMIAEASLVKAARNRMIISENEAINYEFKYFDGTYSKYVEFVNNLSFNNNFNTENKTESAKNVSLIEPEYNNTVDNEEEFYSFYILPIMGKCINDYDNGIAIIPCSTGTGKTHSATTIISEIKALNWTNKKIAFISNLKANLPEKDIKKKMKKLGVPEEKLGVVVKINNSVDWVIEQFEGETPENIENIFENINNFFCKNMNSDDKKKFEYFSSVLKTCIKNSLVSRDAANSYKQNIEIVKGELQSEILRCLHKNYKWSKKSRDERYDFLINNIPVIEKIFPEISIEKADVILMSTLKAMYGIGGILEPARDIRDSLFFSENSIIFIDEFDTAKEEITKFFIEMGISRKINLLAISSHLTLYRKRLENLATDTIVSDVDRTNIKIIVEALEKFEKKYDMSRIYKSREEDFDTVKYMFTGPDNSLITNLKDDKEGICLNQDAPASINVKNRKDFDINDIPIEEFIEDAMYIFRRFSQLISNIATTRYYSQRKNNPATNIDVEISSLLDVLGFKDEETTNSLHYLISKNRYLDIKIDSVGDNIYDNGIKLIRIENNESDLEAKLNFIVLEETAESFLASLAKKHLVFGLSATSTLENCISNFNLNYFRKIHPELLINIEAMPEYKELLKFHEKKLKFASKQNIKYNAIENAGVVSSNLNLTIQSLRYRFKHKYNYEISEEHVKMLVEASDNDAFRMDRILYILDGMFLILMENNHRGGMVYCPASLEEYKEMFLSISTEFAKKKGLKLPQIEILIKNNLSDEGFLQKQKHILSKIDEETTMFIFTTFKSATEGLNLIRLLGENLINKFTCVSNLKQPRLEVDLDFAIFDTPTYIVNEQPGSELSDKIRSILSMGECSFNGQVTTEQLNKYTKEILSSIKTSISLRDTLDYIAAIIRIIMQAIGRLGRTDFKNELTTIVFRADLFNNLKKGRDLFPKFVSYEIIKLIEFLDGNQFINTTSIKSVNEVKYEERAEEVGASTVLSKEKMHEKIINEISIAEEQLRREIKDCFSSNLKSYRQKQKVPEAFKTLKSLKREAVLLKYPTATKEELELLEKMYPGISKYYIRIGGNVNSYSLGYNKDNKIMSFGKLNTFATTTLRISSDGASLGRLTKNPEIVEFFRENGFLTNWEAKEYIVLPSVFQKFYEGTLGEELCKFVFDKLFNTKIKSLPTKHYERFDGMTEINGKKIYIDSKYFQETSNEFTSSLISNAKKKLDIVGGDYAVIINLRPQEKEFKITIDDNVVMIPAVFDTNGNFINKDEIIRSILR